MLVQGGENLLELRQYQKEGVEELAASGRHLLAYGMGLGKTPTILKTLEKLDAFPALIVATKNALGVWEYEAERWLDIPSAVYSGKPKERELAWQRFKQYKLPLLITNYAFLDEIYQRQPKWKAVCADEIHLAGLLNHKTKTFAKFRRLQSPYLYLITGSPMRKNPADLFAPLHLLYPQQFPSYWQFVNKYCVTFKTPFGLEIEPIPKQPAKFKQFVKQYMLRRTKEQVLHDLPNKLRYPFPVEMTEKQSKIYEQLLEEMMAMDDGEFIITPNSIARDIRLRQLLVSPLLLGFKDKGAILETLPLQVESEYDEGNSVVVFTPFREGVNLIAAELSKISDFVGTIRGGMDYKDIHATSQKFQSLSIPNKAMVCTVASSTSFTIHAASAAYFAGCEWDYFMNEQAEDRIHRIGQTKMVRCYYFLHNGTVDRHVIDVVINKKIGIDWVLRPEEELRYFRDRNEKRRI